MPKGIVARNTSKWQYWVNTYLKAMRITGSPGNWKYETVDAFNGKRIFVHGRDYLFPIPSEAIDQNPKLKGKQNPGW